jgi:hypothetical protein
LCPVLFFFCRSYNFKIIKRDFYAVLSHNLTSLFLIHNAVWFLCEFCCGVFLSSYLGICCRYVLKLLVCVTGTDPGWEE